MNKSETIAGLATALAKAQAELSNPKKTSANPFFKSRYADLSEVINVSKPVLAEHGLSILQLLSYADSVVQVETVLVHDTGEYISETLSLPVAKHDAQGIGSAATYARRYAWAAICGLAQEDDDGQAAVGKPHIASRNEPPRKQIEYYDAAKFDKNKSAWKKSVMEGKSTVDSIIGKVQTVGILTDDQLKEIKSWEKVNEAA